MAAGEEIMKINVKLSNKNMLRIKRLAGQLNIIVYRPQ